MRFAWPLALPAELKYSPSCIPNFMMLTPAQAEITLCLWPANSALGVL